MNVEIGTEAALFPEKEYINGIGVAVRNQNRDRNWELKTKKYSQKCAHLFPHRFWNQWKMCAVIPKPLKP